MRKYKTERAFVLWEMHDGDDGDDDKNRKEPEHQQQQMHARACLSLSLAQKQTRAQPRNPKKRQSEFCFVGLWHVAWRGGGHGMVSRFDTFCVKGYLRVVI